MGGMSLDAASTGRSNAFTQNAQQQQQQLRKEQDLQLEGLQDSAQRLGGMADEIYFELEDQARELDALDDDIDQAQGQMDVVLDKIGKLLKTNDRCR